MGAEPVRIGEHKKASSPTRKTEPAAQAADLDAPPELEDTINFDTFDEGSEDFDSPERQQLPEVLRDREGLSIGPFGEVIDPEEMESTEIPVLESFLSVMDETAESSDASLEDESTILDQAPPEAAPVSKLKIENTGVIPPINESES
jgi:hypothetical protein